MGVESDTPVLITVDWGTTNFRAHLVGKSGCSLKGLANSDGLLNVQGDFSSALDRHIGEWIETYGALPVLMSGMVGSRSGWVEAPYVQCPLTPKKLAESLKNISSFNKGNTWIVPGVSGYSACGQVDVMRGEECQVTGALAIEKQGGRVSSDMLCLPGTHNKWVPVSSRGMESFSTTMTGEVFNLLSSQSILSQSINADTKLDRESFLGGLAISRCNGGVLHHIFSVRSRELFNQLERDKAASYLSGLLIGNEIQSIISPEIQTVTVVASRKLTSCYVDALNYFDINATSIDSELATLAGHVEIAKLANLIKEEN